MSDTEQYVPSVSGTVREDLVLEASPERVWQAFAELEQRRRWVRMPGEKSSHALDFRVGGQERLTGAFPHPDGRVEQIESVARFLSIQRRRRIMTSAELRIDGELRVASLLCVEFVATDAGGVGLVYEEQYRFLEPSTPDGTQEHIERRGGTRLMLNGLRALFAS